MGDPNSVHANGRTAAENAATEAAERADEEVDIDVEPSPKFRTPGFHRFRLVWGGADGEILSSVQRTVEDRIMENFQDAYEVINAIYEVVRTPEVDAAGDEVRDRHGYIVWAKTPSGSFEEDFSRLTRGERDRFLLTLTTRDFAWRQMAADAWAEAMFSKAMWEERYGIDYGTVMATKATMGDREARAAVGSAEERYFAIFVSYYSRKADALVQSMDRLAQRLRDTLMI